MTQDMIRKKTLFLRDRIPEEKRKQDSRSVCKRVLELKCVQDAGRILLYAPIRSEVDIWPLVQTLFEQNKKVLLPAVSGEDLLIKEYRGEEFLREGSFHVPEPVQKECDTGKIDVCILPGAAFDHKGNRIGYGRGFYDRFLMKRSETVKIGVGFVEQVVEEIPAKPTDIPMDYIITPLWTNCRNEVE